MFHLPDMYEEKRLSKSSISNNHVCPNTIHREISKLINIKY